MSQTLSPIEDVLGQAIGHHLAGETDLAERLYASVLSQPPPQAKASYGLGLLCHGSGRIDDAIRWFGQATLLAPLDVEAHINLGAALLSAGRPGDALAPLRRAVALNPRVSLSYANLSKALLDTGSPEEAINAGYQAITLDPSNLCAHLNLSAALCEAGQGLAAVPVAGVAASLAPDSATAWTNLAVALCKAGRHDAAMDACRRAMSLGPSDAAMLASLGGLMHEAGNPHEAIAICRAAIARDPSHGRAHYNLASALKACNELADAERACLEATTCGANPDAGVLLAHLRLLLGRFDDAWEVYEQRRDLPSFAWMRALEAELGQPSWRGEMLDGRTLLVVVEQGLGDVILFARHVAWLTAQGVRVVIAATQPLQRLLASLPGVTVVDRDARPLPGFDAWSPIATLPRWIDTGVILRKGAMPYLSVDPALRRHWADRLASRGSGGRALRVGLVWGGNPLTSYDRIRSPGLRAFRPLFDIDGVAMHILQAGPARADLDDVALPGGVIDLGASFTDLADTASAMQALDLVISSCTAPLHLAGALGLRGWGVLPFAPFFSWQLGKDASDWYPTLRLYRQDEAGADWDGVVSRLCGDLAAMAASSG